MRLAVGILGHWCRGLTAADQPYHDSKSHDAIRTD
jgi:hypothetical protein